MEARNNNSNSPACRIMQDIRRREIKPRLAHGAVRNTLADAMRLSICTCLLSGLLLAGPAAANQAVSSTLPAKADERGWNWADNSSEIVQTPEFDQSTRICRRVRKLDPPAGDWPDKKTAESLANCDSAALYYGIGISADPARARECALLEAEGAQDDASPFTGIGILMMIYANGRGAERDLDLATSLACRIDAAPFAVNSRVNHLQKLKKEGWTGHDFDYCDDATSGMAGGFCAARDAAIADAKRIGKFQGLMHSWTEKERRAFAPLQKAAGDYATASGENEVDLSGTLRAAIVIDQKQKLRKSFAGLLKQFESGWRPTASHASFDAADKELNQVYRKIMAIKTKPDARAPGGTADSLPSTTVTKSGIRQAERAWLTYRDAWITFARVKYPKTSPDGLKAYLTRQRIDELKGFLPDAR